jgi:hypothetical protein
MKISSLHVLVLGAFVLLAWLAPAPPSHAQDPDNSAALRAVISDLKAQQAKLLETQNQMEAVYAAIAEDLRQARIYSARGGGKVSP